MSGTHYNAGRPAGRRDSELLGELEAWERSNSADNSEQIQRLRRNLKRARAQELTRRQAEMVHLYYDLGLPMSQIGQALGVSKSSVSRTLARAREGLKRCLQYSF